MVNFPKISYYPPIRQTNILEQNTNKRYHTLEKNSSLKKIKSRLKRKRRETLNVSSHNFLKLRESPKDFNTVVFSKEMMQQVG